MNHSIMLINYKGEVNQLSVYTEDTDDNNILLNKTLADAKRRKLIPLQTHLRDCKITRVKTFTTLLNVGKYRRVAPWGSGKHQSRRERRKMGLKSHVN